MLAILRVLKMSGYPQSVEVIKNRHLGTISKIWYNLSHHYLVRRTMIYVLEINQQGVLQIPSDILPHIQPHTRYQVEIQGETLILRPQPNQPFWQTATPEQRVAKFREWVTQTKRPVPPALSDEAISRETIYN